MWRQNTKKLPPNDLPLSLYIHLPWCTKKCAYCDFNTYAYRPNADQQWPLSQERLYIDALKRDLEYAIPLVQDRPINSIFIGGGTPSLFSPEAISDLLENIRAQVRISPSGELTIEANPETASYRKLAGYYNAGIHRISLGIQSFENQQLQRLGRMHTAHEADHSIMLARKAGFDNINLDLMFGLPGQGLTDATRDLQAAIDHEVEHISWYQLTIEPNTIFYSRPPILPSPDKIWEIQARGQDLLQSRGYQQYEVSAYAKHRKQCQHNLNYWQFGDYLGIGAGAHSKITDRITHTISRFAHHRIPTSYMKTAGTEAAIHTRTILRDDELPLEFFMNTLRLWDGTDVDSFSERTGLPPDKITVQLEQAIQKGMLKRHGKQIKTSQQGYRFLDELLQLFIGHA